MQPTEGVTMLFDLRNAEYLTACVCILTTPQPPEVIDPIRPYLTNVCPECGLLCDIYDTEHAVVSAGQDHGTKAYVVIGCERYHVINPNLVPGVTRTPWQDWTKPETFADGNSGTWADAGTLRTCGHPGVIQDGPCQMGHGR